MKVNRWIGILVSLGLLISLINPQSAFAEPKKELKDESIYDLLVDRFNNGDSENDEDVDTQDPLAFTGGDFAGITDRLDYIKTMNFTMISLGSIFETAKYDGSEVLDYGKIEPHFGTEAELKSFLKKLHEENLGAIADFRLSSVSENHVWVKDGSLPSIPAGQGKINWDSKDDQVKEKLKEAVVSFVSTYELDGIRLTALTDFDVDYLNEVIAAIHEVKPDIYVITNEISAADFDASPNLEKTNALKQSFVKFDPDSSPLSLFDNQNETDIVQLDDLMGSRFTYEMIENRMFPPARWQIAATALFTFPGIPVMPYGTEIAVNGKEAPETHPISNFKTDMELHERIGDLNYLRNESEALRNGDYEMLHNKDGFMVFTRTSEDEKWIVVLNNTSATQNFEIPKQYIGEDKKLRGVLDGNSTLQADSGVYNVVLERELAEIYIVEEDKGFNMPYLIISILIYTVFLSFLFVLLRRGRKNKQQSKK